MKKQVFNPYLPLYEYIPDGEPHVFDGRLYIYGSHDREATTGPGQQRSASMIMYVIRRMSMT